MSMSPQRAGGPDVVINGRFGDADAVTHIVRAIVIDLRKRMKPAFRALDSDVREIAFFLCVNGEFSTYYPTGGAYGVRYLSASGEIRVDLCIDEDETAALGEPTEAGLRGLLLTRFLDAANPLASRAARHGLHLDEDALRQAIAVSFDG
jgi:hypothetical protein